MKTTVRICLTLMAFGTLAQLSAAARFGSLQGAVQIFDKGKWVKATLATKITSGVSIQTGRESAALIVFSRGGQMALKSFTRVTITDADSSTGGTDREMQIVQGEVSGFVKKSTNTPNEFRLRTPTVIAGVRGSLLRGRLQGNRFVATAKQSAAYVKPAPKISVSDSNTRALQSAIAMRGRITAQLADAKKILERAKSAPAPEKVAAAQKEYKELSAKRQQLANQQAKAKNQYMAAQRALARARTPAAAAALRKQMQQALAAFKQASKETNALTAKMAQSKGVLSAAARAPSAKLVAAATARVSAGEKQLATLDKNIARMQKNSATLEVKVAKATATTSTDSGTVVELQQGQTVIASRDKITDAITVARISVRVDAPKNAGVTATEAGFTQQNDDSKIGVGNDFQQIYNQINNVTQPASGGLPELNKF